MDQEKKKKLLKKKGAGLGKQKIFQASIG